MNPDTRYKGQIAPGSSMFQSFTGTLGYRVNILFGVGEVTDYVIWLTEKNRNRAIETFGRLGVSMSELTNAQFVERLGERLTGKPVKFGTREEEYKGEVFVKVAWIDADDGAADTQGASAATVAAFFKGATVQAPVTNGSVITDDDIPF